MFLKRDISVYNYKCLSFLSFECFYLVFVKKCLKIDLKMWLKNGQNRHCFFNIILDNHKKSPCDIHHRIYTTSSKQKRCTGWERSAYACAIQVYQNLGTLIIINLVQSYHTTPGLMIIHHSYIKTSVSDL